MPIATPANNGSPVDRKTVGVDPKLPVQAVVTLAVAIAAYFGFDVSPELAGALSVLLGAIAAYFAPAPKVKDAPVGRSSWS